MSYSINFVLIGATVVLTGTAGFAQVISTDTGRGADAYIERTTPNTAHGLEHFVAVKNDAGTGNVDRKGYFLLDLADIDGPVQCAALEFTYTFQSGASATPSTYHVYGLLDGHPGELWTDAGLTWNNAPGNLINSGTAVDAGSTTHLGSFSIPVATAVPGTVYTLGTPELVAFLQSDTNDLATFIVLRQQANLANEWLASKEDVTYAPATLRIGSAPTSYCTGKLNSAGCVPTIGFSGAPDVSGAQDFLVTCDNVLEQRAGMLIYGQASNNVPFQGGILCVGAPLLRTPIQTSAGTAACASTYAFDFDALIRDGSDPSLVAGAAVYAQWWMRDPQSPSATGLSNGLAFRICP